MDRQAVGQMVIRDSQGFSGILRDSQGGKSDRIGWMGSRWDQRG